MTTQESLMYSTIFQGYADLTKSQTHFQEYSESENRRVKNGRPASANVKSSLSQLRDGKSGYLRKTPEYRSKKIEKVPPKKDAIRIENEIQEYQEDNMSYIEAKIITDESFDELEKFKSPSSQYRLHSQDESEKTFGLSKSRLVKVTSSENNKLLRRTWNNFSTTISESTEKQLVDENASLKSLLYNRESELREMMASLTYLRNQKKMPIIFEKESNRYYFRKHQDFEALDIHIGLEPENKLKKIENKRHGWITVYLNMETKRLIMRFDSFAPLIKSYERTFDVSYIFSQVKFIKAAHLESKSFLIIFEDIVDVLLREMRIYCDTNITLANFVEGSSVRFPLQELKGIARDTEVFWRPLEFIIKKYDMNDELFVEETQQRLKEKYNRCVKFIKRCIFRRRILTAVATANYLYASDIYVLRQDIIVWFRFWKKVKWNEYRVKFTLKKINDDLYNELNGGFLFDHEMKIENPLALVMRESSNHLIFFKINIDTETITLSPLGKNYEKLRAAMGKQGDKLRTFKKESFKAIKFFYLKKMIDISEESWIPGLFTRVKKILWETGVDIFAVLESLKIDLNSTLREEEFSKVFKRLQSLLSLTDSQIRRLKIILTRQAGGKQIRGKDLIEVFISNDSWIKYQMSKLVEMLSVEVRHDKVSLYEFFETSLEITDFNASITRGQLHSLLIYIHSAFENAEHLKAELILDYFFGKSDADQKDAIPLSSFLSRLNLELLDVKGHIENLKRLITRDRLKVNKVLKLMNARMEEELDFEKFKWFLFNLSKSIREDEIRYLFSYFAQHAQAIPVTRIISALELKPKSAEKVFEKLKKIVKEGGYSLLELIFSLNKEEWFRVNQPECLMIFRAINNRISEGSTKAIIESTFDKDLQCIPTENLLSRMGADLSELDSIVQGLRATIKTEKIKLSLILDGSVPKTVDFEVFKKIILAINPYLRLAQLGLVYQLCLPRPDEALKQQPKNPQALEEKVKKSKAPVVLQSLCSFLEIDNLEDEIRALRMNLQRIVKNENLYLYELIYDVLKGTWSETLNFVNFCDLIKSIRPMTTLSELKYLFRVFDPHGSEQMSSHTFVGQFTKFRDSKDEMMHYTENLRLTLIENMKDYNLIIKTLKYSIRSELEFDRFRVLVLAIDPSLRPNSIKIIFQSHKSDNNLVDLNKFSNSISDPKEDIRLFKERFEGKLNKQAEFIMIVLYDQGLTLESEVNFEQFDKLIRRIEPTLSAQEISLAFELYNFNKDANRDTVFVDDVCRVLPEYGKIKDTPMRILRRLQERVVENEFSMYELFILAKIDIRVEKLSRDDIKKILQTFDRNLTKVELDMVTRKLESLIPKNKPAALFILETFNADPKELRTLFETLKRSVADNKVGVLAYFLQHKIDLEKDKINYERFRSLVHHFLGSKLRTEQIFLIYCHLEPLIKEELSVAFLLAKLEISLEVVENLVVSLKKLVKRNKISVFKVLTLLGIEPSHKIYFGDFNRLIKTIDSAMLNEHIKLMFNHLDKNGNGELELQEFMKIILDEEEWEIKQASKILEDLKIYANRSQISVMELLALNKYPPDSYLEFDKFEKLVKSIDQNISREDANLAFQMLKVESETEKKPFVKVERLLTELDCAKNEGSRILNEVFKRLKSNKISILEIMAKLDLQRNNLVELEELVRFFKSIDATLRPEQVTIVFWEYADRSKNKIALGRILERLRWDENEEDNVKKKFARIVSENGVRFLGLLMEAESEDKELAPEEFERIFRSFDNTLRKEEVKIMYQIAREEKGGLLTIRNLREFYYPTRESEPNLFEILKKKLVDCVEARKVSASELILREGLAEKVTPEQFTHLLNEIDPLLFTSGEKEQLFAELSKKGRGAVEVRALREDLFPQEDAFNKIKDYLRRKVKKVKASLPNLLRYFKYDLHQVLTLEDVKKILNIIDPFLRKEQVTIFYKELSNKSPTGVELIEVLSEDQRGLVEFCVDEYMSELRARARANKHNLEDLLQSLNLYPDKVIDLIGLRKVVKEIYPSFPEPSLQMMLSFFDKDNDNLYTFRDFMRLLSIDVFEADKARDQLNLIINVENLNVFELLPRFDLYDPDSQIDFPRFKDLVLEINRLLKKDVIKAIYYQLIYNNKSGLTVDNFLQTFTEKSYREHLESFLASLRKALERNDVSIKEMVLGFNVQESTMLSFASSEEIAKRVFWGLRREQSLLLFHILKRNPNDAKIACQDFLDRFKVSTDNVVKDILEILSSKVKYERIKLFEVYKIFCSDYFGEVKYDEFERIIKVIYVGIKKEDIIILFQYLLRGRKFDIRDKDQGVQAIDFFDRLGYKDRFLDEVIRAVREKVRSSSISLNKLLPIATLEENPIFSKDQLAALTDSLKMKMGSLVEFVYDSIAKKVSSRARHFCFQDIFNLLFDEKWSEEFAHIGELIRNLRGRVLYDNLSIEELFAKCKVSLEGQVKMEQFVRIIALIDHTLDKPTVVLLFRYFDFSALWKINAKYLNNSLSPMGEQHLKATDDKFVQIPDNQELIDDVQDSVSKLNLSSTAQAVRAMRDTFVQVQRTSTQTKKKN